MAVNARKILTDKPDVRVTMLTDQFGFANGSEIDLQLTRIVFGEINGVEHIELCGFVCAQAQDTPPEPTPMPSPEPPRRPVYVVDLHGTLITRSLSDVALQALEGILQRPPLAIRRVYEQFEPQIDTDAITAGQFWRKVLTHLGVSWSRDTARACQRAIVDALRPMPWADELLTRLLERGEVVIATNTKSFITVALHNRHGAMFGTMSNPRPGLHWVTSYTLGALKTSSDFLDTTLSLVMGLGANREAGVLWIDDDQKALDAARTYSFVPIKFSNARDVWQQVRTYERVRKNAPGRGTGGA